MGIMVYSFLWAMQDLYIINGSNPYRAKEP